MWLQLLKHKRFTDEHGRLVMHYPGEILHIKNKELSRKLIRDGLAVDVADAASEVPPGTGVLARRKMGAEPHWVTALNLGMEVATKGLHLPFVLTIIWDSRYEPRRQDLAPTFKVLRQHEWDMAVPIKSYDRLVKHRAAKPEEKELTRKLIRDDRIPYYNPALVFCKRNERTTRLVKLWSDDMEAGCDECLSFMRAVYEVKPYLLPLPVTAASRVHSA